MALNYLGIFFAALAAWLLGAAWYGVLGKQWVAALGWTADDVQEITEPTLRIDAGLREIAL